MEFAIAVLFVKEEPISLGRTAVGDKSIHVIVQVPQQEFQLVFQQQVSQ